KKGAFRSLTSRRRTLSPGLACQTAVKEIWPRSLHHLRYRFVAGEEVAHFLGHQFGVGHKRQMTAARQRQELAVVNSFLEGVETSRRNQYIFLAREDQRRHANAVQARADIKRLHEPHAVGHHALVRLPALLRDKMEQGVALLPAAEEQVEEL